jgi:hypothetical protein
MFLREQDIDKPIAGKHKADHEDTARQRYEQDHG